MHLGGTVARDSQETTDPFVAVAFLPPLEDSLVPFRRG